jgi:hypothetical protein
MVRKKKQIIFERKGLYRMYDLKTMDEFRYVLCRLQE